MSIVASGCGSSESSTASGTSTNCSAKNARSITQNFVTNSKFDVECGKVAVNVAFYFVNNDETEHTVTTGAGAPEAFDADLPQKTSTYAHTFSKPGTYVINCKRHNEQMTLIVQ